MKTEFPKSTKTIVSHFLMILIVIINCRNIQDKNQNQSNPEKIKKEINAKFEYPILLHDSPYIVYPVGHRNTDSSGSRLNFSKLKSGNHKNQRQTFNYVFYNTISNSYHLLNEEGKMLIEFNSSEITNHKVEEPSSRDHYNKFDKWLYYCVIIDDFNGDGILEESDPTYLFISEKSGKNFKQVSPKNMNLVNWRVIKGTNKIIMEVKKDSNKNKFFDPEDEVVPFHYTISKDKEPQEIFSNEFTEKIKTTLQNH